ncbi:ABC transporter ATP-binding protein (fragment) [Cupriavidus neocaledonicus]
MAIFSGSLCPDEQLAETGQERSATDAARMAAQRGVRVYTVGYGTPQAESSQSSFTQLDKPTLRAVATLTAGEYFLAGSAADLTRVYRQLSARLALERRQTEISSLLAGTSVVLIAACSLSLLWFRR